MVSKEQVIHCCMNFIMNPLKVDLVREYCIEKGKDTLQTEYFLIYATQLGLLDELAHNIIEDKIREFGLMRILNKDNQLICLK